MTSRILGSLVAGWLLLPQLPAGKIEQVASPAGRRIAVTVDKLPFMEPLGYWTPREVSNLMLRAFELEEIRAVGFVVEDKVESRPETYVILQDWVAKGHGLGNNTFSYLDLNEVEWREFIEQIADGQKHIRQATRLAKMPLYFRFPMLHEGDTLSKKTEVAKRLRRNDFVMVPATVLIADYEFNHVYVRVADDPERTERLLQAFLKALEGSLEYAEQQSEAVFGRQIPQILRLHLCLSTANFLTPALERLKQRGYSFVSVDEALADPAYSEPETYVGPLGLSFIDRVAATRGLPFREDQGEVRRRELEAEIE